MTSRRGIVAVCAVLVFALTATQATGVRKHSHKTIQVYNEAQVVVGGGQVGSGTVFCPSGTAATGGGWGYQQGLAIVEMGFAGTTSYYVLVDNSGSSSTSAGTVQVACTAGTTRNKARPLTRAQVKDQVAAMVEAREAAHAQE